MLLLSMQSSNNSNISHYLHITFNTVHHDATDNFLYIVPFKSKLQSGLKDINPPDV